MSKTVKTPGGAELPLTNLKGKDYLMVAYRIQWMNESVPSFDISTEFLLLNDEQTVARATVTLADKDGKVIKKATATKRETKKDFSDHTEKAETSAIGRALALLGFGTQFALADLDEGNRIVDTPLAQVPTVIEGPSAEKKRSSFKKLTKTEETNTLIVNGNGTTGTVTLNNINPVVGTAVKQADGWE